MSNVPTVELSCSWRLLIFAQLFISQRIPVARGCSINPKLTSGYTSETQAQPLARERALNKGGRTSWDAMRC
ncbi:hypothetical protein FB451DRAFT_1272263 [Mycena latifolia]|nr:hypothetical protein FB451DRAFT_1272263 [Mycena latifolia]